MLFAAGAPLHAQSVIPAARVVRGEITAERPTSLVDFVVELADRSRPIGRAHVLPDGSFEFHGIADGEYELKLITLYGHVVHREFLSVHEYCGPIALRLPREKGQGPISGTVSMKALMNPVPAKARKEFSRAEQAFSRGKIEESIRYLDNAIRVHPAYLAAHNNLGARYMRMGNFSRAAEAFQTAVEIDPASALAQTNLALALAALSRYEEAEAAARRAVELDSSAPQASYALGLSLAAQGKCTLEAVEYLKKSSSRFPRAHLASARMQVCRGNLNSAAAHLRAYLEVPGAPHRLDAQKWLDSLEQSMGREASLAQEAGK
jgi:tetratricopeptide (TPR) repeat protein